MITAGIKAHRQIRQLAVGIVGWYSGILEDRRLLSLGTVNYLVLLLCVDGALRLLSRGRPHSRAPSTTPDQTNNGVVPCLRATLLRGVSLSWPPEPVRLRSNVTVGGTGVHAEGVLPIWGHQTVWTSNDCCAGGVWEQQIEARLWSRDRTGCCAHSRAW